MRRDFDVFEKFPDGSTLWRATVRGRFETQRKIDELAERSENQFYMLDIQEHFLSLPLLSSRGPKPSVKVAAG
jgi:hypothetical protein